MNDEERKVIISKVSEFHHNKSGDYQQVPVSPVSRWATYAILIPVVVVLMLVGVFFFAALLALLAIAALVIGIRFWWYRKKFQDVAQQPDDPIRKAEMDQTIIIEDAQIIEETEIHRAKPKD